MPRQTLRAPNYYLHEVDVDEGSKRQQVQFGPRERYVGNGHVFGTRRSVSLRIVKERPNHIPMKS